VLSSFQILTSIIYIVSQNKSPAVAKMGDHGHNRHYC